MGIVLQFLPPIPTSLRELKSRAEILGPTTRDFTNSVLSIGICVDISHKPGALWCTLSKPYYREQHGTSTEFEKRCWLEVINLAEQYILNQLYSGGNDDPRAA